MANHNSLIKYLFEGQWCFCAIPLLWSSTLIKISKSFWTAFPSIAFSESLLFMALPGRLTTG